ncbi:MAG: D-lactate dehydrogenase VanH-A [Bauldia sp.]|nr:D-lactate dehydrogenase VanH-A [Bauldia sp.]
MTRTASATTRRRVPPAGDALFRDTAANIGRSPAAPFGRDKPRPLGITVYGCAPDEADLFQALAPRFGVSATTIAAAAPEAGIVPVPGNRCVSVAHKSPISRPVLAALKESGVDYVSTRSIGLDHIDLRAAEELGITVENVAYAPDGVADYTVMLLLMAIRHAKGIVTAAQNRDFRPPNVRGKELRDMTVGVLGTGRIGSAVIERLRGFGCRVLASDTRGQGPAVAEFVSLDALLAESDVVTLHLPLDAGTRHCIGRRQLAALKPGAFLVNTGRGALVDTAALIAALEEERLAGAALDVLEGEDGLFYFDCTERPIDNPFLLRLQALPNVIITPHTAYHTDRVLHDVVTATLRNCLRFDRSRADG